MFRSPPQPMWDLTIHLLSDILLSNRCRISTMVFYLFPLNYLTFFCIRDYNLFSLITFTGSIKRKYGKGSLPGFTLIASCHQTKIEHFIISVCLRFRLLGVSPTLTNLRNDHEFISKGIHVHWYEA